MEVAEAIQDERAVNLISTQAVVHQHAPGHLQFVGGPPAVLRAVGELPIV